MPKLTEKQKRFCEEYLIDHNATQAAIRAGYSAKTANRIASQNLSKLDIQNYLELLMQERSKRTEITADSVVNEIAKIAFSDAKTSGKDKMEALLWLAKYLLILVNKETAGNSIDNETREKIDQILKAMNEYDTTASN